MATALVPLDTLGAEIRARLEAGDKALGKAEDHYLAAGLQLVDARRRVEAEGGSFRDFLAEHQIGKSRAYDLIAVAEGKKTFAGIRAKTAERVARHAERGREAMMSATNGRAVAEEPAAAQPADADELQRLRAENERLAKEIERLKRDLEKAKASAVEQEEMASIRLGRAQQAEAQRDAAQTELVYAKSDKERLTAELAEAQEEISRLTAPVTTAIDPANDSDGARRRSEFWETVAEMDEDRRRAFFAQRVGEAEQRDREASARAATYLADHLVCASLKEAADLVAPLAPGLAETMAAIIAKTPAPAVPPPKQASRKHAQQISPAVTAMFGGKVKPVPLDTPFEPPAFLKKDFPRASA